MKRTYKKRDTSIKLDDPKLICPDEVSLLFGDVFPDRPVRSSDVQRWLMRNGIEPDHFVKRSRGYAPVFSRDLVNQLKGRRDAEASAHKVAQAAELFTPQPQPDAAILAQIKASQTITNERLAQLAQGQQQLMNVIGELLSEWRGAGRAA